MIFFNPSYAGYFFVVPIIMGIIYIGYRKRKKGLEAFVNAALWPRIVPTLSLSRRFLSYSLWMVAFCLLIVAMMRPQYGLKFDTVTRKGQDIYIALDVSKSMLAKDLQPSRFAFAKQEIGSFIENLKGDRIGLILFAGNAFVQCPLTLDYSAVKLFLDDATIGSIPKPGTDLATAIKTARLSFKKKSQAKRKILVIISDGESFENDPVESAQVAKEEGMVIYTVSLGSVEGEPIPLEPQAGGYGGYKKDKANKVVLSKSNHTLMRKLANETGGHFFVGNDYGVLDLVYKDLSRLDKESLEAKLNKSYRDQYQSVLFFVFLLLFIEFLIPDRKRRSRS